MEINSPDNPGTFSLVSCLPLLRQTTRPAHEALEIRLTPVLENVSRSGYQTLLARFFGFYFPMEARLAALATGPDFPQEFELRPKSPLLASDLLALGLTQKLLDTVPICESLPELSSTAQTLGALYVFEGAALGGQIIAPRLQARLGVTPQNGNAFFFGDGPQVAVRWQAFRQVLTSRPAHSAAATAQAALQTFEAFDRWLFPDAVY